MLRFVNITLICTLLGLAFWLYRLKYDIRVADSKATGIARAIGKVQDEVTLLEAEWSRLNNPERIEKLAKRHLKLRETKPEQIILLSDIAKLIPKSDRAIKIEKISNSKDPIAELLGEEFQ